MIRQTFDPVRILLMTWQLRAFTIMWTVDPGLSSSCSTAGATTLTIHFRPPVWTTTSASGPWGTTRSTLPGIWLRAERPSIDWRATKMSSARISTSSRVCRWAVHERDDQLRSVVELEAGGAVLRAWSTIWAGKTLRTSSQAIVRAGALPVEPRTSSGGPWATIRPSSSRNSRVPIAIASAGL